MDLAAFANAAERRPLQLDRGAMTGHIMAIAVRDTSTISLTESPYGRGTPGAR
jgi:hypothetical protein